MEQRGEDEVGVPPSMCLASATTSGTAGRVRPDGGTGVFLANTSGTTGTVRAVTPGGT
jgi:hypothetical protein